MITATYFKPGDVVELTRDWREWKCGDKATVRRTSWEHGVGSMQVLTLSAYDNKAAESDFCCLSSDYCKLVSKQSLPSAAIEYFAAHFGKRVEVNAPETYYHTMKGRIVGVLQDITSTTNKETVWVKFDAIAGITPFLPEKLIIIT